MTEAPPKIAPSKGLDPHNVAASTDLFAEDGVLPCFDPDLPAPGGVRSRASEGSWVP